MAEPDLPEKLIRLGRLASLNGLSPSTAHQSDRGTNSFRIVIPSYFVERDKQSDSNEAGRYSGEEEKS